jgi:nitrite reductase (NO-forming)
LRGRFSSRFAPSVRYYVAAGSLLPVGVALGAWLARGLVDPLDTRVRVAHVAVNLLGWVGLTVLGTLVTLWPTMLRTRIDERAERASRQALPLLVLALGVVVTAAGADRPAAVAAGILGYLAAAAWLVVPMARAARAKPPLSFPTWSVAAGIAWLLGGLAVVAVRLLQTGSWAGTAAALDAVAPYLAGGFVAQVLLGALSYLVPVVLGGGPAVLRRTNRAVDAGGAVRVVLANLGLLVCALPVPSPVRVTASVLVLGALAAFVPVLLRSIRVARRARDAAGPAIDTTRPLGQNTGLAAVGLAAVVLAVAVGGALDPAALGGPVVSADAGVAPTGETTRVTVSARGMRFTPDRIEVPAGNRLVVTVRNTDSTDVHDLVLETGHETGRLAPGERATVEVGVVGRDIEGWCSVVGHRQMGMVLRIDAAGVASDTVAAGHPTEHGAAADEVAGQDHAAASPVGGEPAPDLAAYDPRLPPLEPGRLHRHTFRLTEEVREVAPGVRQEVWTYNGTAPGPVLHGRVGDRFVVRLVNDGTVGHSIDFHAGARAPDRVMRTIPPGESLVYRFTAERAGIWMYHCSTMPMSGHIANGLFGAVVIEPHGLPPVDHSFVLVQSEQFHGADGDPVDMDKVLAETPDAVTFNGYPSQYDGQPLRVAAGDRARFWVLDAGPSRPSSFHVVGGQFDTVYAEGAWLLGGRDGPDTEGGAQVLSLAPAQGGFVELEFPEPGHYPFVSHVMVDAERGAHGVVRVSVR